METETQLVWSGKETARILSTQDTKLTFAPCEKESVNFATTQNLYLEADNLDALRYLRKTHAGKIDVIYIDPPYNTGAKQLTYRNAYPHAEWSSMIFARLLVARELLKDDGFIAIAIDDAELYRLKLIADEVFDERNFAGTIVTHSNPAGRGRRLTIDPTHEYHLFYAKNIDTLRPMTLSRKEECKLTPLMRTIKREEAPYRYYPLLVKDGKVSPIERSEWQRIYDEKTKTFDDAFIDKLREKYTAQGYRLVLPISATGKLYAWHRMYERTATECDSYCFQNGQIYTTQSERRTPFSLWTGEMYNNITYGTTRVRDALSEEKTPFDYAKSIFTVRDIISLCDKKDATVLDFFSGSGTTAHAVWKLNNIDGGTRRFILAQIPAAVEHPRFKNICEIAKEYLRVAGHHEARIATLHGNKLDAGFRVVKGKPAAPLP